MECNVGTTTKNPSTFFNDDLSKNFIMPGKLDGTIKESMNKKIVNRKS